MNRFNRSLIVSIAAGSVALGTVGLVRAGFINHSASQLDDQKWKHPNMHHALDHLKEARKQLEDAEDVFKGHKEEALDHCDKAIKAIHEGLKEQKDDDAVLPGGPAAKQLDDDHFPHLRKARESLKEARKDLEEAAKIFGGHRDEAIEHTEKAIKQLDEALHDK